jgi:hypothetical protein
MNIKRSSFSGKEKFTRLKETYLLGVNLFGEKLKVIKVCLDDEQRFEDLTI